MEKITKKSDFKVTKCGYMYRDGKKISDRKVNPLWYPSKDLTSEEIEIVQNHNKKHWRMV